MPTTSYDGRIVANALTIPLANESIQMCVTSPPYWGLRDYKQGEQIGLERSPREYLNNLREAASEIWRVLRKDGTFWLNLGDSYANDGKWGGSTGGKHVAGLHGEQIGRGRRETGLKPKDLVGIPWRVAFALQEDGWYLRSDIVWQKPNPMPESVTDRPTRSHEYIFLLTKSERYFYNAAAIKEPSTYGVLNSPGSIKSPHGQGFTRRAGLPDRQRGHSRRHAGFNERWDRMSHEEQAAQGRNKRSVWTISTQPYPEAHYATFPQEIPETCILAGSREGDFVLDPFFGSGTTGLVAERLNRRWVGLDLGYQEMQGRRLKNVQKRLTGLSV